jgi:hypothetical protein
MFYMRFNNCANNHNVTPPCTEYAIVLIQLLLNNNRTLASS